MLKHFWSFIAIAIIVIASLMTKAPPLVFGATVVGIIFVLGVAFKKNWCPLFGALLSVFYAILSYESGFFANAAINLILLVPLQLWGWYHWTKKGQDVTVLKTAHKAWAIILTVLGICSSTVYAYYSHSNLWLLDGISSFLTITGIVLLSLKTKEQWFAWIPYNAIECMMWFFAMSIEPSVLAIFVMRVVFLINSLIGAKEWYYGKNIQA